MERADTRVQPINALENRPNQMVHIRLSSTIKGVSQVQFINQGEDFQINSMGKAVAKFLVKRNLKLK